jgi:regulatory protein YycI of two-component signal transduction system YycFG
MKKYFIFIFISFLILLTILIFSPKINKYLEKQKIENIQNSIVTIIKKENLTLYQDDK